MIQEKESEIEAEKLLTELRSSTEGAKMLLSGREADKVEQWIEIARKQKWKGRTYWPMSFCVKKKRAKFILLCKADPVWRRGEKH